ncbi:ferritin family protein [Oceanotoga sp. DSM 15011]|jgi:rubrerythrin|uniref:Rubrerythrin n=1 Tax=Oceanotoga teriensis TaxID=515440 RepID=A0AA45C9G2_9BACT|nr:MULTISPECIES: ferritin family protein [Oceanotoga]MDN5342919.1 hypothetical protein [Oceanotoga sp.]MDO7975363.1 ferritin family protein [Oceanotoga teriensis]PWJ96695.1 rubrerythrin [Oceanotoga teriensis]UYP00133.1 ferritin family protein [Oceanotoga sp. DSM 15011]
MFKNALAILNYAYAKEVEGHNFYNERIDKVKSDELKNIFIALSEMEINHMNYVKDLILKLRNEDSLDLDYVEKDDFYDSRESSEIVGSLDDLTSDLSIIRMAYLIEDDFMKFYEEGAQKVENEEMKNLLLKLSKWEMNHRDLLNDLYRRMMKIYWEKMGFEPLF